MAITIYNKGFYVIYNGQPGTIIGMVDNPIQCYNPKTGHKEPGRVKVIRMEFLNSEPIKSGYVHSTIRKRTC